MNHLSETVRAAPRPFAPAGSDVHEPAEADLIAADLANNHRKAERAHEAQARQAFTLQQRWETKDYS